LSPLISARPVRRGCRYIGFPAQADCERFDGVDVLVIFPFDYRANSRVRISICLGGRFFDCPNFLLTRLHIGRDGVLDVRDICCGAPTPVAGIPQLLLVFLQRFGGSIYGGTGRFRGIPRPHMRPIENRRLVVLPFS
jgi:hypothetical protein